MSILLSDSPEVIEFLQKIGLPLDGLQEVKITFAVTREVNVSARYEKFIQADKFAHATVSIHTYKLVKRDT